MIVLVIAGIAVCAYMLLKMVCQSASDVPGPMALPVIG